MKAGRVPTDVHLLFFLLLGHDHLSPLRQDSHLQLGAEIGDVCIPQRFPELLQDIQPVFLYIIRDLPLQSIHSPAQV
jgi:hypothetical protein